MCSSVGCSDGKEFTCNAGDLGSIPVSGRLRRGEHGNPLQYSCLEKPPGQRSLVSYSPWSRKELDTTERLSTHSTKCAVLWAVVCSTRLCNITTSDFRKLSSPPRKPCTFSISLSPALPNTSSLRQPLIYLVSIDLPILD